MTHWWEIFCTMTHKISHVLGVLQRLTEIQRCLRTTVYFKFINYWNSEPHIFWFTSCMNTNESYLNQYKEPIRFYNISKICKYIEGLIICISMALCKTAVTPLLTHWVYCSFSLSHLYNILLNVNDRHCLAHTQLDLVPHNTAYTVVCQCVPMIMQCVDIHHLAILPLAPGKCWMQSSTIGLSACVITWLCTDSPLQDCYVVLMITSNHPTHLNTGTITVTESSCTHSFPHNDPMHGLRDECVQYYSPPQSCARV